MIINAYSLFDNKALIYHTPFFAPTDGAAVRMVADIVADRNTSVSRHPGDYVLYRIGSYNDAKGMMLPEAPLVHVADAVSLVKRAAPVDLFDDEQVSAILAK